jgi:hypothetical protein
MQPGGQEEIQAIRAELEGLRAQLDAVGSPGGHRWWMRASARPRLAKKLTRIGIVALMLALPVMVSASHQFTDVPTSHTFHSAISKLYGARLTTGCSATRFCPSADVTRGQMAAFLARGLGRGAGDVGFAEDDWASLDGGGLTSVDLLHGGGAGGTAHVLATATVLAYTDETGVCPCELAVWIVNADTGEESAPTYQIISGAERAPVDGTNPRYYETTVSISHLFTVASGVTNTYVLAGDVTTTASPTPASHAAVDWTISAVYIPFGANGGNPSLTTTQSVDGVRRGH